MVTIAWLARGVAQRQINVEAPALVWPLIFFVWIVAASLTQATSWRDGLPEWLKWAEFAVLYIVSLQVLRPRSARLLVATLLLAGVSQAALGAYQFTRQVGPEGFILMGRFMRAYGTLNQPNPYAGYLGYLAPVAVSLTLWSVGRWWRTRQVNQLIACLASMGATVALIAGIFMSWSRGAWLGLAVSLLVVVGLRSRRTVLVTSMVLAALIIVIVVFGAGWLPDSIAGRVQNLGDYFGGPDPALVEITDENFSVLERLAHWRAGWLMFEASPWLGVGIGNYAINYGRFSLPYWYEPLGHAHNVFVNILAETGALGLGAFLAFWLAVGLAVGTQCMEEDAAMERCPCHWADRHVGLPDSAQPFRQSVCPTPAVAAGASTCRAVCSPRSSTRMVRVMNPSQPTGNVMSSELPQFVNALLRLPVINRLGLAQRPREFVRFLKFAIVGAIGMVIDLSVLTASREWLGLPLPLAVGFGFTVAVFSNFTWNRLWTFPESRLRPLGNQLLQFVVVNVIGLGINELVVLGLHPVFGMALPDPPAYIAAKIIAIGIVLFWNYFVNRKWTYKGID